MLHLTAMHEDLRFSWGHIIAFVTMLFVCYVSFAGLVYMTGGDFIAAGCGTVFLFFLLLVLFIYPQFIKGTSRKFERRIVIERIMLIVAPIIFAFAMIPFMHALSVFGNGPELESRFRTAIQSSKSLFESYEQYVASRFEDYSNEVTQHHLTSSQQNNRKQILMLQLQSENYNNLKRSAITWIDEASRGVSAKNVFLLGNVKEIKTSIALWAAELEVYSSHKMPYENDNPAFIHTVHDKVVDVHNKLDSVTELFVVREIPKISALIAVVLSYLLLMFPYFLQNRHPKSWVSLLGSSPTSTEHWEDPTKEEPKTVNNNHDDLSF